jgi:ribose 5-phosphate isomerase A
MNSDAMKRAAAEAAIALVRKGMVVGVGTGSTANHFINALAAMKGEIAGAVASSQVSASRLEAKGIEVLDLNEVRDLPLYVDGADEIDRSFRMIKGGGGALTREKIVAAASACFVCIADESKLVERLGAFPVAVEAIPMAGALVARRVAELGGRAVHRHGFVTDNGQFILDVHGLRFDDPAALETALDGIPGVVANGIFAHRPADILLLGTGSGVKEMRP